MASIGRLTVQIGADVRGINEGLNRVNAQLNTFGKNLGGIGKGFIAATIVSRFADIGREALAMSAKYEAAFLKIKNLTDTSSSDLKLFNAEIRKISANVGVGILDLSEGLYNITSSGLTGKAALEALEIAAKGAAIGMGTTDEIAKALSGTLNAYGPANLSAARAAEILFQTTKKGAIDINELTNSLSGVTPLAAKMGVSLEEVGAFLATVSLNGTSASEGVTQLASVFDAILKPSEQAKDILAKMGISLTDLNNVIRTQGIREGLLLLEKGFNGNTEAMSKFFGRREAILGFLGTLGASSEKYGDILEVINRNTDGFRTSSEEALNSTTQKWEKLKATASNYSLQLGDIIKKVLIFAYEANKNQGLQFKSFFGINNAKSLGSEDAKKYLDGVSDYLKNKSFSSYINTFSGPLAKGVPSVDIAKPVVKPLDDDFLKDQKKLEKYLKGLKTSNQLLQEEIDVLTNKIIESRKAGTDYSEDLKKVTDVTARLRKEEELRVSVLDEINGKIKDQIGNIREKIAVNKLLVGNEALENKKIIDKEVLKNVPLVTEQVRNITAKVKVEGLENLASQTDGINRSLEEMEGFFSGIGEAASAAFGDIAASLITGGLAFKDFGQAALDAARQIVKAALASAIASVIQKAIGALGIVGIGVALAGAAIVSGIFKSKVPKLAKGGLAFGPQLAVVGDNPNAASDPEVIAPLSKLSIMVRVEVLKLGAILSNAFEQSLKELRLPSTSSNINVNVPSIGNLSSILNPVINSNSILEPAPIQVSVYGSIRGNDIVLLGDRLGATNNRLKANKY